MLKRMLEMAEDAPNHLRVFDERDQLEKIPATRTREHVEAKLRCISSAHSQFVRDDDVASVVHRPVLTGVSGSRARGRDRHADRAPSTPVRR